MKYENVKFGKDCREKLIEGVNLTADAVEVTFGPEGRNSIIAIGPDVKITKDGYHTAMMINDRDPYVTMGIKLVQDTCKKTAKDAGDGSSTTAILMREIVNSYKDTENPIRVARGLKEWTGKALDYIKNNLTKPVTTKEEIFNVASLSANNDPIIGELIAEAFNKVGKDGIVTFEESEDVKDRIDYSEGFRIENGYSSPYFINSAKGICELEDVRVFISETKMDEVKPVIAMAEQAVKDKKSLLLIAPEFDSEILVFLSSNLNLLKSCTVISPAHRNYRNILIEDMRALLGSSMECKKVIITKDTTTFLGCESDKEKVDNIVKEVRATIEAGKLNDFDLNFHKKRLANFTAGIATIYVGGYSQVEVRERYDRIEDAVCATQAAMEEGIVTGGGITLLKASENLFELCDETQSKFLDILKTPNRLLGVSNVDETVIEPFLVTKISLENAVSTASMILTADVAIIGNTNNYMN